MWGDIVTFVDFKGLPALVCACKMTRDAARDEDMLARDKVYVLRCWFALGDREDTLKRGYREGGEWKMREEPSDDVSEWLRVTVERGRVTKLLWSERMIGETVTGITPAEIGALDGLTSLLLTGNQICGPLPSEIGRLTSLTHLFLNNNRLEGPLPAALGALTALAALYLENNNFTVKIPSTLANLNLESLSLYSNNFNTNVPSNWINNKQHTQRYMAWLKNPEEEFPFPSDESESD